jgi:hypothetical protein
VSDTSTDNWSFPSSDRICCKKWTVIRLFSIIHTQWNFSHLEPRRRLSNESRRNMSLHPLQTDFQSKNAEITRLFWCLRGAMSFDMEIFDAVEAGLDPHPNVNHPGYAALRPLIESGMQSKGSHGYSVPAPMRRSGGPLVSQHRDSTPDPAIVALSASTPSRNPFATFENSSSYAQRNPDESPGTRCGNFLQYALFAV